MFFRLGRIFRAVGRDIVTLWYAFRHPSTPLIVKLATLLLAVYTISPIDVIPDWLAVFGWVDDVTLLALVIPFLLKLVPQHILRDASTSTEGLLSRWKSRQG